MAYLNYFIPIALIAVSLVLLAGLVNMMRGKNPGLSQKLMRWRVGLQFAVIVVLFASFYFVQ